MNKILLGLLLPAMAWANLKTGFEQAPSGEIRELKTTAGTWTAAAGHAEVTGGYHYTGKQCLHIFGGKERMIEFKPAATVKMPGYLVFQAERWTSRNPFQFRIEEQVKGKWVELFNGDRAVVVGRAFKSRVNIPLTRNPERLRFICTSPERSGLLIDDLALITAMPQKVTGVTVEGIHVPVLRGLKVNPLLRVRVEVNGTLKPIALTGATAHLSGSVQAADLAVVQWLASGTSPNVAEAKAFGKTAAGRVGAQAFSGKQELQAGANYFWLSLQLSDRADIDRTVRAMCSALTFPMAPSTNCSLWPARCIASA